MWYKYVCIPVRNETIQIGIKFSPVHQKCIIGGRKSMTTLMERIARNYFGTDKYSITFPNSYKVRLEFKCDQEMADGFSELIRERTEFLLLETNKLGRLMR